jgi:hypothetical protein
MHDRIHKARYVSYSNKSSTILIPIFLLTLGKGSTFNSLVLLDTCFVIYHESNATFHQVQNAGNDIQLSSC